MNQPSASTPAPAPAPLGVRVAAACGLGFAALTLAGWTGETVARAFGVSNVVRQGVQAALMTALVVPGVWLLRQRIDRSSMDGLAVLGVGRSLRGFALGAGLILAPYAATLVAIALFGWATLSVNPTPGASTAMAYALLTAFFFEALPEELLFRGYIFRNLNGAMTTWSASLLTAALFTIVPIAVTFVQRHLLGMEISIGGSDRVTGQFVVTLFLFGCMLQYLRVLTGTVWTCIGFHLLFLFANRLVGVREGAFVRMSHVTSEGPLQLLFLGSIALVAAGLLLYPRLTRRSLGWRERVVE